MVYYAQKAQEMLKLVGFASYTIENDKVTVKFKDLFYFFANISIGIFICYISWTNIKYDSDSLIIKYGNMITVTAAILFAIISMIFAFV